jgi:hypothetical protein
MRGFSFPKIRAGLIAGYQLWGSSSKKADIHRKNNYCVVMEQKTTHQCVNKPKQLPSIEEMDQNSVL